MSTKETTHPWRSIVLSLLALAGAAGAMLLIFSTEPDAKRTDTRKRTAMLIETLTVTRADHKPVIRATGTVQAADDVILSAQVAGELIWRSEQFEPGAFIDKGSPLVRIDARDYRNAVVLRRGELSAAKADLQIEKGRQNSAQQGLSILGRKIDEDKQALVLRKPQLGVIEAQVQSAQAQVRQSQLAVERTTVKAPFDAHIIDRRANLGTRLTAGQPIARIVGVDTYFVVVNVPLSQIRWLEFSGETEGAGSLATLHNPSSWPANSAREGVVARHIAALSEDTRMARVLVSVADPLARAAENQGKPKLLIGEFLSVEMTAKAIAGSVQLDREFLRDNDTVWLAKDGTLHIRKVEVAFRTKEHVYIREGLSDGDAVITTSLATVREGGEVRLKAKDQDSPAEAKEKAP